MAHVAAVIRVFICNSRATGLPDLHPPRRATVRTRNQGLAQNPSPNALPPPRPASPSSPVRFNPAGFAHRASPACAQCADVRGSGSTLTQQPKLQVLAAKDAGVGDTPGVSYGPFGSRIPSCRSKPDGATCQWRRLLPHQHFLSTLLSVQRFCSWLLLIANYAINAGAQGIVYPQTTNATATAVATPTPLATPDTWLVTPSEALAFKGEDGFNAEPAFRPSAVVPLVDLVRPEPVTDLRVKAPLAHAVQFNGQADAPLDPATFKMMYGALKLDITNRITKFVTVTKEGFSLENAKIPADKHRLTLQIQDEKQRVAERELRVEVE